MKSIEIKKISITDIEADCIVNAANSKLAAGSGVCGAIFEAAGMNELQDACNQIGGCKTGKSVITPGFKSKAKYIIHSVGPIWNGGNKGEKELLSSCYSTALKLAMENGCHSIAFPLISSGIYGYPKSEAWEVAIEAVKQFLAENHDYDLKVYFAIKSQEIIDLGLKIMNSLNFAPSSITKFHKTDEENGYLSNWYPSKFTIDGNTFCCAEQYMMYKKAMMFGDAKIADKIMKTEDPSEMQMLGKLVKGFEQNKWDGMKQIIVYKAVTEKFRQNNDLMDKLQGTGDSLIVECSKSDKIWGIGMGMDDQNVNNPKLWQGKNLLGYILQTVREDCPQPKDVFYSHKWFWDKCKKVFWFSETTEGNQKLIRPDGTYSVLTEKSNYCNSSRQAHAGWQRANLLMSEYGIWDATCFAASMSSPLGIIMKRSKNEGYAYLFTSCQAADHSIYPFLDEKSVGICRENVERFYANPALQVGWGNFILHPVCLKVTKGKKKLEPVFIGDIGESEEALGEYFFDPVQTIEKKYLKDFMTLF